MDCICLDFCLTEEARQQKIKNRRINQLLRESKRKERNQFKLLLLGTGESGKSTFIRQMRIIYDNGYTTMEKMQYAKVIVENILNSMQTMIWAMDLLRIPYTNESMSKNADIVLSADVKSISFLTDPYLTAIKLLWNDAGIQECFVRRREYQLIDSTKYFMTHIDRIAELGYIPTDVDILHMRVPTVGLIEYRFKVEKVEFRMIDVGGQRSERKKWIHCFDNVKAILFLVATSEYDQALLERENRNRLVESRHVFQSVCNIDWFYDTAVVVFFNKTDLLEEKIMYSDLATYFPKFQGPRQDYLKAREFISQMFVEAVPTRKLYKHFTCATDTENIKVVFAAVRDTILNAYLKRNML